MVGIQKRGTMRCDDGGMVKQCDAVVCDGDLCEVYLDKVERTD